MATSFFMGSDKNRTNLTLSEDYLQKEKQDQQPPKPRRKPSKVSETHKKKPPQRGMGVEKLERLRIQERWKKMTEINTNKTTNTPSLPFAFIPTAFTDPMPFGKSGGSGPGVHGGGVGGLSLIPAGFSGGGFFPSGQGVRISNGYLCGVDTVNRNSKELPSIPNLLHHDYCADCFKKKRNVRLTGDDKGFDGAKDMYADIHVITDEDLVNGNIQNFKHSGKSAPIHACTSAFHNTNQGAKVVALHRKANTMGRGNHVLMEYEFFPGDKSTSRSQTLNEFMMMMKLGGAVGSDHAAAAMAMGVGGGGGGGGGEASCVTTTTGTTTTTGADDASTCVDLSLKLSY